METKRQSNFELLRMLAMLMIVISHFGVHGTYEKPDFSTSEQIANDLLNIGGKLGANLFVMIGAYFLIGKPFKAKRVVALLVQTWLYSLVFVMVAFFVLQLQPRVRLVDMSLFPFPEAYWFVTAYLFLLLLTPLLNRILMKLSRQDLAYWLFGLFIFWVIMPTFQLPTVGVNNVTWFSFLYLVVGYIKLYPNSILENKSLWLKVSGLSLLVTAGSVLWYHHGSYSNPKALELTASQLSQNAILTFINTVSIFLVVKNTPIKYRRSINILASYVFGVYLIHEQPIMREVIWGWVNNQQYHGGVKMLLMGLLWGSIVFITCWALNIILQTVLNPLIQIISRWLEAPCNRVIQAWRQLC